jgi:protein TonB
MTRKEEEKNKRIGLIISLSVHGLLLLLCFFLLAWQAPDPPLPEYGVELNFGLDAAGSDEIQTISPAAESEQNEEQPAPGEEAPKSTPVQEVQEIQETPEPTPVVDNTPSVKTTEAEAPVYEAPAPVKPAPKPSPKAEYPAVKDNKPVNSTEEGAKGKEGISKEAQANKNGDQPGKVGDQGSPEGKVDAKALYGTPGGGGGGSSLEMTGWMWDYKPVVKDNSSENGRIVFKVTIDDQGEVMGVDILESSVSPAVAKVYENEVRDLTFSKTKDNTIPAPTSTGKITFIIRSR